MVLDESVCEYCLYSLACTQATPSFSILHVDKCEEQWYIIGFAHATHCIL